MDARQADASGHYSKKVVTANQQRTVADYLSETYHLSQRRIGKLLKVHRSTLRYTPRVRSDEEALIRAIQRLARRHPRFGSKRIHACWHREGWQVNRKRARRLWNELGFRRVLRRRKARKSSKPGTSANSCVNQPSRFKNDVWTCDFIADRMIDGRSLQWLTLVDEYTRECLALVVGETMTGAMMRRVLVRVLSQRGAPRRIRSDNG